MGNGIVTNKVYDEMVKEKTPDSKKMQNMFRAFWVGGMICMIGEGINRSLRYIGIEKESSAVYTSIILILVGAVLTGLNVYEKITKYAGAGSVVPITGFANSVVSPAMEFKNEGIIAGTCVKIFTVAGPVLVFGIVASVIVGLIRIITGI